MTTMRIAITDLSRARKRLRELIEAGLDSGQSRAVTARRVARLKAQALGMRRSRANP
jgi:hypothetical protein